MRILQFDSIGGASGDMILGALADLGVSCEELQKTLRSLSLGHFEIVARKVVRGGLRGTEVSVVTETAHGAAEPHRNIGAVLEIIARSALPETTKAKAAGVFRRLAEVEAAVHGVSVDEVHFHEIGAVDSIVDIAGSCLALDLLRPDEVCVGPLPAGYGTVQSQHGVLPVPAPATVELLKGHPLTQTDESSELVTPTGAALLTAWKTLDRPPDGAAIASIGYGFGQRQLLHRPNVLRAIMLETEAGQPNADSCLVLECNIDDTSPELLGSLSQRLLEASALDVFTTAVQMKKQRPGVLLTVLARAEDRPALLDLIFRESTTFGVREHQTARTVLERRHVEVETPYGKVRVKIGTWKGEDITQAPEHDDCVRCATQNSVSVRAVYEAARQTIPTGQRVPQA